MSQEKKPRVFIGSARESLDYVAPLQELLSYKAMVTAWTTDVFRDGEYPLDSLDRQLDSADFAVFMFTPDDITEIRGQKYYTTRDNTIFEMGFFMGRLGRERVIAIIPDKVNLYEEDNLSSADAATNQLPKEFHLLSDLSGLTLVRYETDRGKDEFGAALNVAANKIVKRIEQHKCINRTDYQGEFEKSKKLVKLVSNFYASHNKRMTSKKYIELISLIQNAVYIPPYFNMNSLRLWKKDKEGLIDGLKQVAGVEGQKTFFRLDDNSKYVVKAYNEKIWTMYKKSNLDTETILCYVIGKDHVISIHFDELTNHNPFEKKEMEFFISENMKLFIILAKLLGDDKDEK